MMLDLPALTKKQKKELRDIVARQQARKEKVNKRIEEYCTVSGCSNQAKRIDRKIIVNVITEGHTKTVLASLGKNTSRLTVNVIDVPVAELDRVINQAIVYAKDEVIRRYEPK